MQTRPAATPQDPSSPGTHRHGVVTRLRRVTVWQWGLVVLVAVHTWYFTRAGLRIHHGLGTSSYDFGLYDQGVWLMSRLKAPFVTLMGRNLFGDHTSFVLLPLVPFYMVWPAAGVLFFAQSAAIAAGAIPVFLYARGRLESEAVALLLAAVYLVHPAVQWANVENFHPDAFLGVFVGTAIYAALQRRWRLYAVFVVLALLVKEDAALVVVPLGIWVAMRRHRRIGLLTVAGGISAVPAALFLVIRPLRGTAFPNSWRFPFGGMGGLMAEAFRRPWNVLQHLWSGDRPWYLFQMAAPLLGVFTRLPDVALIGSLALASNLLSTFTFQHQIEYHYSLVVVPALALGTVHALGVIRGRVRAALLGAMAVAAIAAASVWGPLPFSANAPDYWPPDHPAAVDAREILEDIPDDAVVSAFHRLTAHLAHRQEIYAFPSPFRTTPWWGNEGDLSGVRIPAADRVEYVVLPVDKTIEDLAGPWAEVEDEFHLVRTVGQWELYVRVPG
ncbi:MAG: DUF2079 domain-containing protein, partial [Actinomycetota bacterium]